VFIDVFQFSTFGGKKGLIIMKPHKMLSLEATPTPYLRLYKQCRPKVVGPIFFKSKTHEENTYLFYAN